MTAIPQSRAVRQNLEAPLKQVARRQWSVLATRGVLQTLLVSLTVILAAMLIISFLPALPLWGRITAAVLVWGTVLAAGIYFLRPAMKRRSLVSTAMDVERAMAAGQIDTQERITSSLELSQVTDPTFAGSTAMIEHLHRQAEVDAKAIVPEKLIPAGAATKFALLLIPLLAAWVFLALYLPPNKFLRPLHNLLMPWQETPAILSDIIVSPGSFTVAQGDPIEISVKVNPKDEQDKSRKIERAIIEMKDLATGQLTTVALGRVGPRDFKFTQAASRSFSYRIQTDGGDSTMYVATVEPVPSVESLAVRYDYPAYTQIPSRVDVNKDEGAIDAIQGTSVTLTVTSAKDLTAASRIVVTEKLLEEGAASSGAAPTIDSPAAKPLELPLTRSGDGLYEAKLKVQNPGTYAIELINPYNRPNRERQSRPITVRFDEKPTVAVTSPTAELSVRPNETVPVAFQAGDDFGLAKVELMTQVEDGPVNATAVKVEGKWPRTLAMSTPLSLTEALGANTDGKSKRISYWIRVTDNRDPSGQVVESSRQSLRLDANVESLAARVDRQNARDFTEAIRVAIRRLENAHPFVDRSRVVDEDRTTLRTEERRTAEEARNILEKTATELTAEANANMTGPFAAMALTARQISENRILGAASLMAKFDLHADQPSLRKQDATQSLKEVSTAKKELEELLKKVEEQAKLVEAQHKLQDLARKQEEVAQKMAEQGEKANQNNQQNALKQQTQQVINETPQLQNKEAQQAAQALNELLNEVAQLQDKQEQAIEQNQKQAELAEAAEAAKDAAEMQKELNAKISDFAKAEAKPLEQAAAKPPEQQQLENIVKDLNAAKLQQAAQQQMEAAKKLEQNAQQLQQQAQMKPEQAAAKQQQAAQQAEAQANQAMAEAKKAEANAQQAMQQAKAAQDAAQQAMETEKQAAKAEDAAKQASDAAAKAAAANKPENAAENMAAQKDAAQKAAEAAMNAKKLADQAEQMVKAVQQQAQAMQNDASKQAMHQAAKKAGEMAKKADDTADQAQAAADQAQAAAQQAAQAQQQKNADQAKNAAAEAAKKAAEAGVKAEQAAKEAAQAQQQMAQAQQGAAQQAQAQANAQQQKAQAMQQQAQAQKAAAQQAMQQQPKDAAAQQGAAQQAKALAEQQKALAQQAQENAQAMAQAQQKGAMEPKQAAAQQQQVAQQAQKAAQKAQQLAQQAEKAANANLAQRAEMAQEALNQAQQAQAEAAKAQAEGNNEEAAGAQEAAQNALARAEQALRGQAQPAMAEGQQAKPGQMPQGEQAAGEPQPAGEQPAGGEQPAQGEQPGQAKAGEPQEGQPQAGQPQAGQPQGGQPQGGQPQAGQPAQQQAAMAEPHPGEPGMANQGQAAQAQAAQAGQPATPQQAMQQAAQAAAEATAAQGQAAQGNQAAAQQAAQALAQAAQALAQAAGQQGQQGQGQAQAQGQQPGQGETSEMPSPVAGQSGDPKQGIAAQTEGGSTEVPPSVVELGINPSDWAKLAPLQQQELLNAAQQAGPPEYQAMIRNYYIRLARIQGKPAN